MRTLVEYKSFSPVKTHGISVVPSIQYVKLQGTKGAQLSFLGDNSGHLAKLRSKGAFRLPKEINYAADLFLNTNIQPPDWLTSNNTNSLFDREVCMKSHSKVVVASNAGNAPLHDYEVNYDVITQQPEPIAAKDFEVTGKPMAQRRYFCVTYGPELEIDIQYVQFDEEGRPTKPGIEVAVGGRPLVNEGREISMSEVLTTSVTDPRHVIQLPEMQIGTTFLPVGLRSIQHYIGNGKAEEIVEKIRSDAPILIDIERERALYKEITSEQIIKAFALFGYQGSDYQLSRDVLHVKLRYNLYRHTFWAKRGEEIIIGIVSNDLKPNRGDYDAALYDRVLKATGVTILQMQSFLVQELEVEQAVLMGNGKDPRIYISEQPHVPSNQKRVADNDARDSITAGLISISI